MNSSRVATYMSSVFAMLMLLSVACTQSEKLPYQDYYYPWMDNLDTVIYVYKEESNMLGRQYHLMTSRQDETGLYVIKEIYNEDFQILSSTIEKKIGNGFVAESYIIYGSNADGELIPYEAEVKSGQMFYYDRMDDGQTLVQHYQVNEVDSVNHRMIIIKNLSYKKDSTFTFDGSQYPALWVEIDGEIENIGDGSVTLSLKGENIYAKGIGCVIFTQSIENTISHNYIYQGKLNPDEWNKLHIVQ